MSRTQEAILALAAAVAADGSKGHIDIALPSEAMELLRRDAAWIRRFDVATSAHSEALCLWGPAGVVTLRTRVDA